MNELEAFAKWLTEQYDVSELDWSNRYLDGPERRHVDAEELLTAWGNR